jgi:hypothetical protein
MHTKHDWGSTAAIVEPPAELMPDAAGSSAIPVDDSTSTRCGSMPKALLVTLLAALLESSPPLAVWLGRGILWVWPGMRRA